jgi:hypothetical protein
LRLLGGRSSNFSTRDMAIRKDAFVKGGAGKPLTIDHESRLSPGSSAMHKRCYWNFFRFYFHIFSRKLPAAHPL